VTGLLRYTVADFVRSARFLWPALAYLGLLPVIYATAGGPPLGGYGLTAVLLYPAAAWTGLLAAGSEGDVQRQLTATAAGGTARVLLAKAACGLLAVLALTAGAVAYPAALGLFAPPATATDLAVAAAAHLLCGAPGLALGLLFGRPCAPRQAHAWLWLLLCLVVTIPVDGLVSSTPAPPRWLAAAAPPVLAVGRALFRATAGPVAPALVAPAATALAFSAAGVALFVALGRARA
jgi:hypothetical protein